MIERVSNNNLDEVLPLIEQYQAFYKAVPISASDNKQFFAQFGEDSTLGCQFLYRSQKTAVGFATVYFTFNSTIAAKVAILNDLYVLPGCRGQQIGKRLIEHCRSFALKKGAARLQWVTAPDNTAAQKVYDSLNVKKSEWLFYTY